MVFFISKSINVLLATYQGAIFIDCNTARLCPCCRMNPASRRRLIRSRIRISDVEDTRREESFNGRCPNGRISLFNSLDCSKEMITLCLFKLFYQESEQDHYLLFF